MSDQFNLQTDLANTPQGAVALLGAITPILRALSSDNVSPLAVVQLEAIGHCFHMSGPMARQTPAVLTRNGSMRLSRLRSSLGWMAGDTASALAQTAGGQTAALLILCLVEMFCRNFTGHLLFELSLKILPTSQCLAGMGHLSDLAEIIANKMQPLAFGQHHAIQLTRIREAYFLSGIEVDPSTMASLLDRPNLEVLVGMLDAVQQALRDETTVVHITGFQGLGSIVALVMGLCPDDVLLLVENGIISQGQRRSIVVSILHKEQTTFTVEKIIRGSKNSTVLPISFRDNDFLSQPGRLSSYEYSTFKSKGCLATMTEQLMTSVSFKPARSVIISLVNCTAAIMLCFTGSDFGTLSEFPAGGLRSLLGARATAYARDRLQFLFDVEPCLDELDPVAWYRMLRTSVAALVPDRACTCRQCGASHVWSTLSAKHDPCPLRSVWGGLQSLVGHAILLSLLDTDLEALRIVQCPQTKMGPHVCRQLIRRVESRDTVEDVEYGYSVSDLHNDMCHLMGAISPNTGDEYRMLGTSNGATSVFPATLESLSFDQDHTVRYKALDGQFHDGRNYYKALMEDICIPPRPLAVKSILQPPGTVCPSGIGAHSDATLSVRPFHNSLALRTMILFSDLATHVSFHGLQLAYMNHSVASACNHDKCDSVSGDAMPIMTTGLEAPLAGNSHISVVLTHGNSEAQFLAGVPDIPTLFQGESCLGCCFKIARSMGYRLIIQS